MQLPKISIVTPSYNQGEFLESTINSVLSQNYPNLEYIIVDGASTDNSVDIIKKYESSLAYWVSEPDKGQSNALNKGFRRVTGELVGWLNSDDLYMPNTLKTIGEYFKNNAKADMAYGDQADIDEKGRVFRALRSLKFSRLAFLSRGRLISQPTAFFKRKIFGEIGYVDESLPWVMDYEFFLRIAFAGYHIHHIPQILAKFRYHKGSKTVTGKVESNKHEEYMRMIQKKYLVKTKLSMLVINAMKVYFKIIEKMINLDRYFFYRNHYAQRIKSILNGGNLHKY